MKVLVAGANGKTGRRIVRLLVEAGHEARGLVRKEEQLGEVEENGAEPVLVDLENEEVQGAVGRAVEGCDAVIFAAGAGPGSGAARKETMDYSGAAKLVEAAEANGVRRYVMLSSMGADDPEGASPQMRPYLTAKANADRRLEESGLDYTVLRPGSLTNDAGNGAIAAAPSLGQFGRIPREDVAATIVASLQTESTFGKTFEILSGDTPIQDALRALGDPVAGTGRG